LARCVERWESSFDDSDQRERNAERVERRRESCVRHRASPQPSDSSAVARSRHAIEKAADKHYAAFRAV
jgi:hypothetical protein